MENEEIIKNINEQLDFIKEESKYSHRQILTMHVDTIHQGRELTRYVITVSLAIIGIIVPLLFKSEININKNLLLASSVCLLFTVSYGIILSVYVIRKELSAWPKTQKEISEKMSKDTRLMIGAFNNPTQENYLKALEQVAQNHKPKEDTEKKWKNYINHDTGFYGLFIIGLILLVLSIF
jgi:hypothetical protein